MSDYIVKNALGGVNDVEKKALARAKRADLVTLPQNVRGTNCGNCKWVKNVDSSGGDCKHPEVAQRVNARMCCALWAAPGMYTPFKRGNAFD